jgi:hypothetical protein
MVNQAMYAVVGEPSTLDISYLGDFSGVFVIRVIFGRRSSPNVKHLPLNYTQIYLA